MTLLCRSILHRPSLSSLLSCCYRHDSISRRAFHTTPRYQFIDTCLSETHTLINSLHTISGLSWAATLPLTALIVRFILISPITTYVYSISRQRLQHRPLLEEWAHIYRKQIIAEHAALGPKACQKLLAKKLTKKSTEIYRNTGTQRWKGSLNFLQLPIWLTLIETIRRMCGTREGLLGILQNSLNEISPAAIPENHEDSITEPSQSQHVSDVDDSQILPLQDIQGPKNLVTVPVEPSLATEGALWFPDLLSPDPHVMLPFILSAIMFANISYQQRTIKRAGWKLGAFQRRMGNAVKIVILAVGPLTLQMPSAIHVYWISSSIFALANNILLDWYMPTSKTVQSYKPQNSKMTGPLTPVKSNSETHQLRAIPERKRPNRSPKSLPRFKRLSSLTPRNARAGYGA